MWDSSGHSGILRTAIIVVAVTASLLWAQDGGARISTGQLNPASGFFAADLPPGAMQAKARTACLECHEARIILQQRLSKAAWTKEVDKMIKWGAIVDKADHDALIDYLNTSFPVDKPPYEAPRTASTSK
jgi:hypothetical protein